MRSTSSARRFKVGDWVIVNRGSGPYYGRRGVVVDYMPGRPFAVRIRLDDWLPQYSFGVNERDLKLDILDTLADL